MPDLDPVTLAQMEEKLRLELTVLEALSLLGTLQLALRHPEFRKQPTAGLDRCIRPRPPKSHRRQSPQDRPPLRRRWHKAFDQ